MSLNRQKVSVNDAKHSDAKVTMPTSSSSDDDIVQGADSDAEATPVKTDAEKRKAQRKARAVEMFYVTRNLQHNYSFRVDSRDGRIIKAVLEGTVSEDKLPIGRAPARLLRGEEERPADRQLKKVDFDPVPISGKDWKNRMGVMRYQRIKTMPGVRESVNASARKSKAKLGWRSKNRETFVSADDNEFDIENQTTFPMKHGEQAQYQADEFADQTVTKGAYANAKYRKQAKEKQYWVLERLDAKHVRNALVLVGVDDGTNTEVIKDQAESMLCQPEYKAYRLKSLSYSAYRTAKYDLELGVVKVVEKPSGRLGIADATSPEQLAMAKEMDIRSVRSHNTQVYGKQLIAVDAAFNVVPNADTHQSGVRWITKENLSKSRALIGGRESTPYILIRIATNIIEKVFETRAAAFAAKGVIAADSLLAEKFAVVMQNKVVAESSSAEHPVVYKHTYFSSEMKQSKHENSAADEKSAVGSKRKISVTAEVARAVLQADEELSTSTELDAELKELFASVKREAGESTGEAKPAKRRRIPVVTPANPGSAASTASSSVKPILIVSSATAEKLGTQRGEELAQLYSSIDESRWKLEAEKAIGPFKNQLFISKAKAAFTILREKISDAEKAKMEGATDGVNYVKEYGVLPGEEAIASKAIIYRDSFAAYRSGYHEAAKKAMSERIVMIATIQAKQDVCDLTRMRMRTLDDVGLKEVAKEYKVDFAELFKSYQTAFPTCKQHRDTVLAAKKIRDEKDIFIQRMKKQFHLSDFAILTTSPYAREEIEAIHGIQYKPGVHENKYPLFIDIDLDLLGNFGLFAAKRIQFPRVANPDCLTRAEQESLKLLEYTGKLTSEKGYMRALNSANYSMRFMSTGKCVIVDAALEGNAARFANHAETPTPTDSKEERRTKANTFYLESDNRTFIAGVPGSVIEVGQRICVTYAIAPKHNVTLSTQEGLPKAVQPSKVGCASQTGLFRQKAAAVYQQPTTQAATFAKPGNP